MKNLKTIALSFIALVAMSANAQTQKIDVKKSNIHWVGKKITGQHEGTIALKDGSLVFKAEKLAGGNFTVDMTTINTTDLEGGMKQKLDGHLKSEDFFGTEKFNSAKLVFKTIADKGNNNYTITADLTIKGITNPITFDMNVNDKMATTKLIVDRTKYNIKYNSGNFFENLGDKTIYDDFELDVTLNF